jgi:hypothetical protein
VNALDGSSATPQTPERPSTVEPKEKSVGGVNPISPVNQLLQRCGYPPHRVTSWSPLPVLQMPSKSQTQIYISVDLQKARRQRKKPKPVSPEKADPGSSQSHNSKGRTNSTRGLFGGRR